VANCLIGMKKGYIDAQTNAKTREAMLLGIFTCGIARESSLAAPNYRAEFRSTGT
jgi:hypothetical protein